MRKKRSTRLESKRHFVWSTLIALIIFAISTGVSLWLSHDSLQRTEELATPVTLGITQQLDEESQRWNVTIKNEHPSKPSGDIYVFQPEASPFRPSMVDYEGLAAGESKNYSFWFHVRNKTLVETDVPFREIPISGALYYEVKQDAISLHFACNNCPPTGYYLTAPEIGKMDLLFTITSEGFEKAWIPIYYWPGEQQHE